MEQNTSYSSISYGIYDLEANNYRYLFTSYNDDTARRQFIAYCVGSNSLFNEPLELHSLHKIGHAIGNIEPDFRLICKYSEIKDTVNKNKETTNRHL